MPRYFFDTADGHRDWDSEGVELADDAAARSEAVRYAGQVLSSQPDELLEAGQFRLRARDAAGRVVIALEFIEVADTDVDAGQAPAARHPRTLF